MSSIFHIDYHLNYKCTKNEEFTTRVGNIVDRKQVLSWSSAQH